MTAWWIRRSKSATFQESDFDEGGGHYRVVVDADPADYDMQKMVSTLRRLVAAATDWMDDRPYQTYLFIYHFPRGAAGRRHGARLFDRHRYQRQTGLARIRWRLAI